MPEIPDRVPGGLILSSYANDIRDRTAQRYASAVERDSLTPLPAEGSLAYLDNERVLQVFQSGIWTNLAEEPWVVAITDPIDERLAELEALRDSFETDFTSGTVSLGTSPSAITATLTVDSDGTYEVELVCVATCITAGQTGLGGLTFGVDVNGSQVRAFGSMGVRHNDADDAPVDAEWGVACSHIVDLVAGDQVRWTGSRSATFTTAGEADDRRIIVRRVA